MKKIGIIIPIVFILAACSPAAPSKTEIASTEPVVAATATVAIPTNTLVPPTSTTVPTATIEPTATPEVMIFRDDFEGVLQPGWVVENGNPKKLVITDDGWLKIIGEDASLFSGGNQSNLLWRELPEGDFAIVVHLQTTPYANFQQAAIFIFEDYENYITINRGYCDLCSTGGQGVYMDYKLAGQTGDYSVPFTADDLYLKLESKENVISGYYATSPDDWTRLGRFGNVFQFKKVGLGVSNCGSEGAGNSVITGQYDYFEIIKQ